MENTDDCYYNFESQKYSKKRYEGISETYVQFFFKKRKSIVLNLLSSIIGNKNNLSLLDIACADGIMTEAADVSFPGVFSKFVGTDIAPLMIEVAKNRFSTDKRFSFFIKDECPNERFDIVFGLGYMSASIFESEMTFLDTRLKSGGYYLCTLASSNSLFARIKLSESPLINNYLSYSDYEKMLSKYFEIVRRVPYGLFIPKLWAFPSIARVVQPISENIFKYIFPNLFHEKIYLLRKK